MSLTLGPVFSGSMSCRVDESFVDVAYSATVTRSGGEGSMPYAVNQGIRIFYEVAGEGPVVVLMHGIGDTSEIWHRLGAVERLATKFTVVTIDARGLGESDHPTEPAAYVRQLRRDDTVAVLDAISADQAHLVGYSLGGRNALYVSTAHPERVASVVAIAANPFPTPMNLQLTAHLRRGRAIYLRALGKLRRTMMGFCAWSFRRRADRRGGARRLLMSTRPSPR